MAEIVRCIDGRYVIISLAVFYSKNSEGVKKK